MIEKTKLEEMSAELPEQERRELLARIRSSFDKEEREEVERVELKHEERERLVARDMEQLSLWARFQLWLQSLLTGRSRKELFLAARIALLRRSIRSRAPGLTGFETRNLTQKFARQLYDLYHAAFPLRDLFQTYSRNEDFREEALAELLAARYPEAKKDLEQLVPASEMEAAYAGSGSDEEVRKLVLRRITDYQRRIPDRLYEQLEEGLKPLSFFRSLVLFPYSLVFRHFNHYPGDRLEDKYPYFDDAPVMLMLDLLERLFAAVSLAVGLGPHWFCHEEVLASFARYRLRSLSEELPEGAPAAENGVSAEETEREAASLGQALFALGEAAAQFDRRVPLLDLLRYFRRDPYLSLNFALPRAPLRAGYAVLLRERFLGQFSEKLYAVKKAVIERRLRELFRGEGLQELFYYNDRPLFDSRRQGPQRFSHTRSLSVLFNYISRLYKTYVQEAVQAANSYVYSGNRIAQTRLMQSAGGLEELEAKILLFDRSLSPEEEDGRTLASFRSRFAADAAQQKLFRSFISQKDKEARDLLEQGIDCLQSIKRQFDDTLSSPAENVRGVLKTLHFSRGRNQTLAALLKSTAEQVGEALELLRQLELLEKGS